MIRDGLSACLIFPSQETKTCLVRGKITSIATDVLSFPEDRKLDV
jgi:hypothetical protein